MEKSVVSLDTPVIFRGITIIPLVKMSINYSFAAGISVMSIKQPLAAVIVTTSGKKYFRITGEEISRERFIEEFPSIRESLEGIE